MKLPNSQHAVIDERKVREYLLSPSHPVGRFKAKFFAALGFGLENWAAFVTAVKSLALENDAELVEDTEYGRKYFIRGVFTGPSGRSADVDSVWIIRAGNDTPRLVTVYPR